MPSLFHSGESWHQLNKHDFLNSLRARTDHETFNYSLPQLRISNGTYEGYIYSVPNAGLILGRDLSCQISLDDPTLSRQHCRFFAQDGELWVCDLSSANGTFVNDETIGAHSRVLHVGDSVSVGETFISVIPPHWSGLDIVPDPASSLQSSQPPPSCSLQDANSIPSSQPPIQSRHFSTFQRFKSAPFCVKFASVFIFLHFAVDVLASSFFHEKVSLFAYATAWLLYEILKRKNYARITLLIFRISVIPFSLIHLGDSTLPTYLISAFITFSFSLFYLIPLFLPSANSWFHPSSPIKSS